jgi:hypothetical protein
MTVIHPITGEKVTSHVYPLFCTADLVARRKLQQLVGCNAYCGCFYCLLRGEHIEGAVRYIGSSSQQEGHRLPPGIPRSPEDYLAPDVCIYFLNSLSLS